MHPAGFRQSPALARYLQEADQYQDFLINGSQGQHNAHQMKNSEPKNDCRSAKQQSIPANDTEGEFGHVRICNQAASNCLVEDRGYNNCVNND